MRIQKEVKHNDYIYKLSAEPYVSVGEVLCMEVSCIQFTKDQELISVTDFSGPADVALELASCILKAIKTSSSKG